MWARVALAGLVLLSLGGAAKAQLKQLWQTEIGEWMILAKAVEATGAFNACISISKSQNGIYLMFLLDDQLRWEMTFADPRWRLQPRDRYTVSYAVDADTPVEVSAVALTNNIVSVRLADSKSLFNRFRQGQTLHVKAQRTDLSFRLTDTSRMLSYLLACAANKGRRPQATEVARSDPFSAPASPRAPAPAPAAKSAGTPNDQERRAEATMVAANLISELGLTGFRFIRVEANPLPINADAIWKTDAGLGTVSIVPLPDANAISSTIISIDAKHCKKAFASGSLPADGASALREGGKDGSSKDDASSLARLFTRCGMGDDALVGYYLIVPRPKGGHYVVGTFSVGAEDGAKSFDSDVRAAVYRALPK